MVGDELGAVVAVAREPLDPGGGALVPFGSLRPCQLGVGDLLDQAVREAQLDLARDARTARAAEELLALEPEHDLVGLGPLALAKRAERAEPDRAADHRRVLEQALLLRRERVEAGGDDPLHRLGQRARVRATLDQHAHVLLRVEWVAARTREQLSLRFDRQ